MVGKRQRRQRSRSGSRRKWYYIAMIVILLVVGGVVAYYSYAVNSKTQQKPIIMYVNQGNGAVNGSNFARMVSFAHNDGFNTVFFQIYRQGDLLFNTQQLRAFVNQSHAEGMKIFFALYITNSSQSLPTSVYSLGEDGVSLDMSTLEPASQEAYLSSLESGYHGETAVTTTDMGSPLKPGLLVLETYSPADQPFIKHGIVGSVGVFETSSEQDYKTQFQYALQNSDGVLVFDYAALVKHGY